MHILTWEQELGQTDISAIKKAELKERLAAMRKTFDKQIREKETALNKEVRGLAGSWFSTDCYFQAVDRVQQHFKGGASSYIAVLEVNGSSKVRGA